jgi:hypothetical protein
MPTFERLDLSSRTNLKDYGIYKAIIIDILYADDPKNSNKNDVEYKIRILHGSRSGMEYTNVRKLPLLGGYLDFDEEVLQHKQHQIGGSIQGEGASPENYDNSHVMIAFLEGDKKPIILGGWPHPKRPVQGSTEEEGKRILKEFNSIRYNINKDGELILTYLGGIRDTETFEPENIITAPLQIKITKEGGFFLIDKEVQEFKLDRENKTITLTQYDETLPNETEDEYLYGYEVDLTDNKKINEIKLDKENKTIELNQYNISEDVVNEIISSIDDKLISITQYDNNNPSNEFIIDDTNKIISLNQYTGGAPKISFTIDNSNKTASLYFNDKSMEIKIDENAQKITIDDGGGDTIEIDSPNNKILITQGTNTVEMGNSGIKIKEKDTGELNLSSGKVALGSSTDELMIILSELCDTLFQDLGNLGYPLKNQMKYQILKTRIDSIKGSL